MAPPPAAALPLADVDDEEADADHDEAWEAELDRRIADVREGRVQCVPWEQVKAEMAADRAEIQRERARAAGR
jgi:putative addiction module component (TIGR02574 family)